MRKSVGAFLFVALLLFSRNCFSQKVDSPYEVGTWQGFRSAAISYTFDDNCSNQLALAVPMFDEFDFNLTLFTVTNWSPNWTGLQNAASKGHEIASHTVSHPSLNGLSDAQQLTELKNSQDIINAHITEQRAVTIAYPNCNVGNPSLVRQLYFAARGCQGYIEGKTPGDFMNISSIICGSLGSIKTSTDFNSKADNAASSKGWCVYLIHGIDNDGGYSPLPSDTLRVSLEYLKAHQDKFWIAAFANVAKYIKERNSASVSEILAREDSLTVEVSDTLDNSYYNCPITVRRPLPQGWTSSGVMQNGKNIESTIVEIDTVRYVMFDVIPDDGAIVLIKDGTTGVNQKMDNSIRSSFALYQNYPNPFNPSTSIRYRVPSKSHVGLAIYNLVGQQVATLVDEEKQAGSYNVYFYASHLSSGVYVCRLFVGGNVMSSKMILLK